MRLGWLDWSVIALYAAAVLSLGRLASRGHTTAEDLLVAGRSMATWAVLASMVATELSAATFLGVPEAAYSGTWSYLELAFGALLGKLALSRRVIPLYHRLGVVSVYQLLEDRFGGHAQRTAAGCFLAGRLMASGVRLFIAALAFSIVTGTSVPVAILGCGVVAGIYTRAGGLRSVIWTDVLQALVFLAGATALLVAAVASVDGGLGAIWEWASLHGRGEVFTFAPFFSLTDTRGFGTALVGGFFLTLATHGTDQDMVQRLLAARGGRQGGLALSGSALTSANTTPPSRSFSTSTSSACSSSPTTLTKCGRWRGEASKWRIVCPSTVRSTATTFRTSGPRSIDPATGWWICFRRVSLPTSRQSVGHNPNDDIRGHGVNIRLCG